MRQEVKAYLANQLGFSETGRHVLDSLIIPKISAMGIVINNPFLECGKQINWGFLAKIKDYEEKKKYWEDFSIKVTPINNHLMRNSDCLLAILDGGHAVDDGVASEIGYYAGIERGPIFALRSDFRGGENIGASINPQLLGYILQSGGKLVDTSEYGCCSERWFKAIEEWRDLLDDNTKA